MKFRKAIALMTSAALMMSLAGCSEEPDDDMISRSEDNGSSSSQTQPYSEPEYDNQGIDFSGGATRLSMSGGNLTINRRSRPQTTSMSDSGWTILVYLCGSDLESGYYAATSDIAEAIEAEYSDDVRIIYQTGGANGWYDDIISSTSVQRWENVDGDIELIEDIGDRSMGSADTLADFVSWGVENYPAKHMGLVMWDHGGGSISGVCFDERYDYDSLSLTEIDTALNSVYDKMTDKFEFIGFDACLMSTMEAANILTPYARYMFASQETEPGSGWNYTDIMSYLAENPDADGAALGRMQCGSFYQHCQDSGDSDGATFAIIDLSKMDALLTAFDKTAREMYEYSDLNEVARAVYNVENFGGNNRTEGYTNMIDLKGMLNSVKSYAPSASDAISALEDAVVCSISGPQHKNAGGLSVYYPLYFDGSEELSIFSDVCTSPYYLALVDAVGYGSTGADVSDYSNSGLFEDSDNFWDENYTPDYEPDTTGASNADTLSGEVYFDDEGTYTVRLDDMSAFNYATCTMFMMVDFDPSFMIYIGEDDEVGVDYDSMTLTDEFYGNWPSMGNWPVPITTVSVTDERSIYTVPIKLNGVETNLRIDYDWNSYSWNVIGTWEGVDQTTGAASRDNVTLKDGDVIEFVYTAYYLDDSYGDSFDFYSDPITYNNGIDISYEILEAGEYDYSMTLYDVYGNYYFTDSVTFTCDGEGGITYDPDEL